MNSTTDNIMIQILEELKELNKNIEFYTDITLSHYIAVGEIEMESVQDSENLDS